MDTSEPSDKDKLFQAYTDYARLALHTLYLMNAGAAVAILTLLDSVRNDGMLITELGAKSAVLTFCFGVVAGALSLFSAFRIEFYRFHTNSARGSGYFTVGFAILSLLSFVAGCCFAILVG
ncbi:MAG: hypothetical protein AAGA96_18515 [Verrucomicrobiota bacterium]